MRGIERRQHLRIVAHVHEARSRDRQEPQRHHRTEQGCDSRGPARLHREQRDQDHDGERHDVMLEAGLGELEALDRGEDRDRRRDDGIAVEHGGTDDAEHHHRHRTPPDRPRRQRRQRQRSPFPVIVGAQQDQHVFQGDDDYQRPQDEREHAEHEFMGDRAGPGSRRRRFSECVERAGADVAIDDADAPEREAPEARPHGWVLTLAGIGCNCHWGEAIHRARARSSASKCEGALRRYA